MCLRKADGSPRRRETAPASGARLATLAAGSLAALALPFVAAAADAPSAAAAALPPHAARMAGLDAVVTVPRHHDHGINVRPWLWVGGSLAVTGGLLVVVDSRRRRQFH